jgi:hypothetical protein
MSTCIFDNFQGPNNAPAHFPFGIRFGAAGGGAVNNIGIPGQQGFGVGICPGPLPAGMSAAAGATDAASDSYGNYVYTDGSTMVWVPAFFYKYGDGSNGLPANMVDIKPRSAYMDVASANAAGYALHRAFYDGGERDGFFVDKYLSSNNGGVMSSIKLGIPLDTDGSQSGVGSISGVGVNNYGMVQQAAKSRGVHFHSMSIFMHGALALLSLAHAQASTGAAFCAWYSSGATNYPKGCNNNALGDSNDASLTFESAGHSLYPAKPKTGSANFLAKTTHNGQNCGVVDLNGSMWEVAPGITSDGTNVYALKPSIRMRDLIGSDATSVNSLFGAAGIAANYDSLGATIGELQNSQTVKYFGSASPVLSPATSGANWQASGAGIPFATGGTNQFGNDGFWDYRPGEMCPIVGASWANGSLAGVWALSLFDVRASADSSVGGRAALYL